MFLVTDEGRDRPRFFLDVDRSKGRVDQRWVDTVGYSASPNGPV